MCGKVGLPGRLRGEEGLDVIGEGLLVALGDEEEICAAVVQVSRDRCLGEQGIDGDRSPADVGDQVHGRDEDADLVGGLLRVFPVFLDGQHGFF